MLFRRHLMTLRALKEALILFSKRILPPEMFFPQRILRPLV